MGFYAGKKVFIVGGSKGIGRELALLMAREGARVWVAARGLGALHNTVEALEHISPVGHGFVSLDVTDPVAVEAAAKEVLAGLGGLDVLVCNSGFAVAEEFANAEHADFERMMAVNFYGHVNVVRAFTPHFAQQRSGDICLVSSMMGFLPLYGYTAYSASKFAVAGFGEALRQEFKLMGVRVGVYFPPTTETPGLEAENVRKPPVVWRLESDNAFSKTYQAPQVAASMARCIEKGVQHGMVGADSKFIHFMNRVFPRFTRFMADGEVRSARNKVEAESSDKPAT
jgi:NAD(P)-dependent dehydrogenase (short-subunit alcohol dehydrogenase family)